MPEKRIIVLGAGQLGTALASVGGERVTLVTRDMLDITDEAGAQPALASLAPDVVINATAYNRVDDAETHAGEAFAVNAIGPGLLARATTAAGARFVHVSTDYVFSGARAMPYPEDALPAPLGVYGASKLAGEHLAAAYATDALVVRTCGVFGPTRSGTGGNFVRAILRQAAAGRPLSVVADTMVAPTYALDLATAVLSLVDAGVVGLVHATNSGHCSWYEFACAIVAEAGLDMPVEPTTSSARPTAARRPAYSVLDLSRLESHGIVMRGWRDALHAYIGDYAPHRL
jgi:dTDP-4-dehydrorhamnose reductase